MANKHDMYNDEIVELESLEEVEETDSLTDDFEYFDINKLLSHPKITNIKETMQNYSFPSVILNPRLYLIYENPQYRYLFDGSKQSLPRNFALDFPHDLGTEELGTLYKSLQNKSDGYSFRGRFQSINRNKLNQLFNVNISPIFTEEYETPIAYQAFFDNVTLEQKNLLHSTFLSLLEASKLKDNDTGNHIKRVGEYSKVLAQHLFDNEIDPDITPEFIHNIQFLAQMHDVGKIGTPDDILNKEGPLDDREWEIMREHTINGAYIMSTYPHPMAREIALFHHEHWDGSGYPYNLSKDMIPISARIVAIADVYDALRMQRSYKAAFNHDKATEIIIDQKETHFDPVLIDVFMKVRDYFNILFKQFKD